MLKHMKKIIIAMTVFSTVIFTSCYHRTDSPRGSWAKGADLSWLSEMEHDGVPFYTVHDSVKEACDCMELLRGCGMNAVRLRVWVHHSTGWSNKEDMLTLARRAAKAGQRIMIDFHYSDFFADPHQQDIPAAWRGYNYDLLCEAVREHTLDVLYALKEEGIKPEWVQVGNETPNGMLWPVGRVKNPVTAESEAENELQWEHYAGLTTAGYNAVKEAFADATVIVHVDNAYEYRDWFWRALEKHGGKYDMIGLSHYPMMTAWSGIPWQEANRRAEANIRDLIGIFHKPVMIAEVGMMNWGRGAEYDSVATLSAEVMADFLARVEAIDSCAGVFYWEPECYGGWRPQEYVPLGWSGYDMGSFTPEGIPSPALERLLSGKESHL